MQRDTASRGKICCLCAQDKLPLVAEPIELWQYRKTAIALIAADMPMWEQNTNVRRIEA